MKLELIDLYLIVCENINNKFSTITISNTGTFASENLTINNNGTWLTADAISNGTITSIPMIQATPNIIPYEMIDNLRVSDSMAGSISIRNSITSATPRYGYGMLLDNNTIASVESPLQTFKPSNINTNTVGVVSFGSNP